MRVGPTGFAARRRKWRKERRLPAVWPQLIDVQAELRLGKPNLLPNVQCQLTLARHSSESYPSLLQARQSGKPHTGNRRKGLLPRPHRVLRSCLRATQPSSI